MSADYTYQVARIRALETGLLTDADIEQLISAKSPESIVSFLEERGWGRSGQGTEDMLSEEQEKIWDTVRELRIDMSAFDVLFLPKLFHNVKAAIKAVYEEDEDARVFYDDSDPEPSEILDIVRNKDFDRLPDSVSRAAEEAYDSLTKTGDGQLCDIIIDRACLDAISEAGETAGRRGDYVLRDYADDQVAIKDIKIAVRGAATGKQKDFLERAIADCRGINKDELIKAALSGENQIREYLEETDYREGAGALSEGVSRFEKWCDDRIMDTLRAQKYETFTIGPVIAYVIAREAEIKEVRMILACKANGLPEEDIRTRKREMYV